MPRRRAPTAAAARATKVFYVRSPEAVQLALETSIARHYRSARRLIAVGSVVTAASIALLVAVLVRVVIV